MTDQRRAVTEFDLRKPEFQDFSLKLDDLEFREDGKIVRKDRWLKGVQRLASVLGYGRQDFEIDTLIDEVETWKEGRLKGLTQQERDVVEAMIPVVEAVWRIVGAAKTKKDERTLSVSVYEQLLETINELNAVAGKDRDLRDILATALLKYPLVQEPDPL